MVLILTNVIQDMILNNIQKILAVDQTPCVILMPIYYNFQILYSKST